MATDLAWTVSGGMSPLEFGSMEEPVRGSKRIIKSPGLPWLVWLSGVSAYLQTKGSLVLFPVGYMPGLQARSLVGGM